MASKILVDELAPQSHATDVTLTTGKKIAGANTQFKITGGANTNVLSTDGAGGLTWGAPVGLFTSYAVLADQKTSGTAGGGLTSGSWVTHDLQTEIADRDSIVSITANKFTLAAGNYFIKWTTTAWGGNFQANRLSSISALSVTTLVGTGGIGRTANVDEPNINMIGMARVTPVASTDYIIEQKIDTTVATHGFGKASSLQTETYAWVEIYKEL